MKRLEDYERSYEEGAWAEFGNNKRQRCMNKYRYDRYLACGYTDAPEFDQHGWLKNDLPKAEIEKIKVFEEERIVAYVECVQLPNGKWVSGCHWMLSMSGRVSGCSIFGKQYDSRIEALVTELRCLLGYIRRNGTTKDKELISDIINAINDVRQLSLF